MDPLSLNKELNDLTDGIQMPKSPKWILSSTAKPNVADCICLITKFLKYKKNTVFKIHVFCKLFANQTMRCFNIDLVS